MPSLSPFAARRPVHAAIALLLVLLAAPVAAIAASHPRAAASRLPNGFIGVNLGSPVYPNAAHTAELGQQLDTMVASGVETVRVEFDWAAAQPYASSNQLTAAERPRFTASGVDSVPTDFTNMDALVAAAAQRRLALVPVIVEAPGWDGVYFARSFLSIPDRNGPYANFCAALVKRYGPHGTFWRTHRPYFPVRSWQIWNEPNLYAFWPVQPFAARYVSLLAAAHKAIKRVDPAAKIVLAGLTNFSWISLRHIYAIRGARNLFDEVALHPYTRTPQGVVTILLRGRRVMDRYGDHAKPLLADEISWPSAVGHLSSSKLPDFGVSEAGQAKTVAAALPLLAAERKRLGLAGVDYYTWAATENPTGSPFDYSGLLKQVGGVLTAKPVLAAFRRVVLGLEGCAEKAAVATACRRPG